MRLLPAGQTQYPLRHQAVRRAGQVISFSLVILLSLLSRSTAAGQTNPDTPDFTGTLAIIGNDDNVYTLDAVSGLTALTDDASSTRHYQYPTWSTDGRLAYFCCDPLQSGAAMLEVYVRGPGEPAGSLIYDQSDEIYTYAYWSPADCADGSGCRDLAVLVGGQAGGFKVVLMRHLADTTSTSRTIGRGAPFYFSWAADGRTMFQVRDNLRMDIYDVDADEITETLPVPPGLFAAPALSPVDDRRLYAALNRRGNASTLTMQDGETRTALTGEVAAFVAFAWSPDGEKIAYRLLDNNGYGDLIVVNSRSGLEISRTGGDEVIAFFWSPDSQSLAYVSPVRVREAGTFDASYHPADLYRPVQQGEFRLRWSVLNTDSGLSTALSLFAPTDPLLYLLTYFDQFAQSHRLWSPDSRYLVYAERNNSGNGGQSSGGGTVSILDTTAPDAVPFTVADGVLGIWSFD